MKDTIRLLLVDDSKEKLAELKNGLRTMGYQVRTAISGEHAVNILDKSPQEFDFILIDHLLGNSETGLLTNNDIPIDGIETCRKIHYRTKEVIILIYSYVASDNPKTIDNFRRDAYSAGAVRYLRRTTLDPAIEINEFIAEISNLKTLRDRLHKFQEYQKELPSLSMESNIGIILIDNHKKIWYLNKEMRKILNCEHKDLLLDCAYELHGFQNTCDGCILKDLHTHKGVERISLQPIQGQNKELRYLKIWSQPILDDSTGKIIAMIKSCRDLTNTKYLKSIDLQKRLKIITRGLGENEEGFDFVRLYLSENPKKLRLASTWGHSQDLVNKITIDLDECHYLQDSLEYYKKNLRGEFFPRLIYDQPFEEEINGPMIHWPIVKNEKLQALLSVSGGPNKKCDKLKLKIVNDYAREIEVAIRDSKLEIGIEPEIEDILTEVETKLLQEESSEEIIEYLISSAVELTNSDSGHLRYVEGDNAILFPRFLGNYPRIAQSVWKISRRESLACRVIMAKNEDIRNNVENDPQVHDFRKKLTYAQRKALDQTKSLCFIPLIFMDECIGTLGLHSTQSNNYTKKSITIVRKLGDKIAFVLHDHLIKIKSLSAQQEITKRIVHNISNPLDSAHTFLKVIKRNHEKKKKRFSKDDLNNLYLIEDQFIRIKELVREVIRFNKPLSATYESIKVDQLLTKVCSQFLKGFTKLELVFDLHCPDVQVLINEPGIRGVLENLMTNSIKAMNHKGKIVIGTVRENDNLTIIFEDNGPGVPEAIQDKLFKEVISCDPMANGIGLLSCKRVISEEHFGNIYYDKKFKEGAKFIVELKIL